MHRKYNIPQKNMIPVLLALHGCVAAGKICSTYLLYKLNHVDLNACMAVVYDI
jgi:hypothetical protein